MRARRVGALYGLARLFSRWLNFLRGLCNIQCACASPKGGRDRRVSSRSIYGRMKPFNIVCRPGDNQVLAIRNETFSV